MEDYLYDDCESLLEQSKLHHKLMSHNRRWLIGLANEPQGSSSKFQIQKPIPEYLLREDDSPSECLEDKYSLDAPTKLTRAKLSKYFGDADLSKDMSGPESPPEIQRS
nr:hypothetical protein [Tanacetum cinerariifolium]